MSKNTTKEKRKEKKKDYHSKLWGQKDFKIFKIK